MLSRQTNGMMALLFFIIAFLAVPLTQLNYLTLMPGDIGDARLNHYFLENIYQFIRGRSGSLIHLPFFYPFPYILGFSDNLLGSFPAYFIPRVLTRQADTAFQIWYLFGYFVNYIAAYSALRMLQRSETASIIGALIFTFSLPETGQMGHMQLHYRFGVPLAIATFFSFLNQKDWHLFISSMGWLIWQFYCSIYIGFFLMLFLIAMTSLYLFNPTITGIHSLSARTMCFIQQFRDWPDTIKLKLTIVSMIGLLLLLLLFYPYIQVSTLYHAKRHWHEIAMMLPRLQSYFLSNESWLWSSSFKAFDILPMRHEHAMFIGAIPMLLTISGVLIGKQQSQGMAYPLLGGSLAALILLTLNVGGVSLWYGFTHLPLASSIRTMTRICLVFLFPVGYLSAIAIDYFKEKYAWANTFLFLILVPALLFEFSATSPDVSSKTEWRERLIPYAQAIPDQLPRHPILFFAQLNAPPYASELDAMWVALKRGIPTLNGYSGLIPPGWTYQYNQNCEEWPKRIQAYLQWKGDTNLAHYRQLAKRIVPIGFTHCDPTWLEHPPQLTSYSRTYTESEFKMLSIQYINKVKQQDRWLVHIKVINSGNQTISALSTIDKPIRLSWRWRDTADQPLTGWDTRKDLPYDIPAHSSINMLLPIETKPPQGKTLEVSMVQEAVFWMHDLGIQPIQIHEDS